MICLKKVFEQGTAGQDAAEYIKEHVTKPVVGYVVGISAPPGKTMGLAGAIISGGGGIMREKMEALEGDVNRLFLKTLMIQGFVHRTQ